MWEDLIYKAKEGGLDVIETYIFWNVHEPSRGNVPLLATYFCFFFFKKKIVEFEVHSLCVLSACNLVQYNFEGRYDLVRFVKTIQKAGLYAHLRIGPYVCAEWNFGYLQIFSVSYVVSNTRGFGHVGAVFDCLMIF